MGNRRRSEGLLAISNVSQTNNGRNRRHTVPPPQGRRGSVARLVLPRLLLIVPAAQAAQPIHWRPHHLAGQPRQAPSEAALPLHRPTLRLLCLLRQLAKAAGPRQRRPRRQLLPAVLLRCMVLLLQRGGGRRGVCSQVAGRRACRVGQALRQRIDGLWYLEWGRVGVRQSLVLGAASEGTARPRVQPAPHWHDMLAAATALLASPHSHQWLPLTLIRSTLGVDVRDSMLGPSGPPAACSAMLCRAEPPAILDLMLCSDLRSCMRRRVGRGDQRQ